jgi:hypothetical protein
MDAWGEFQDSLGSLCHDFERDGPGTLAGRRRGMASKLAQMAARYGPEGPGSAKVPPFTADQLDALVRCVLGEPEPPEEGSRLRIYRPGRERRTRPPKQV